MKKIVFILIAGIMAINLQAQKKVVNTAESLLNKGNLKLALDTIKYALNNDETKDLPTTWYLHGMILQNIALSADTGIKKIVDNPAVEAYNSYQKAISLDPKQKIGRKIDLQLNNLYVAAVTNGGAAFEEKNYKKALELFELALNIETNPIFKNIIDTAMMYNCGLAALNAKDYDKAAQYFTKAAQYGYNNGVTYSLLKTAYLEKGDTASAVKAMQEGFEKYPNDLNVIVDLINYYLVTNQSDAALKYLNMAKEKDPGNPSFYFAEGTLYERTNEFDKAEAAYKKSIEIDPNYFNAVYNLAVLYYNNAVKIFDQASNEKDDNKYQELLKQGDNELRRALPYLENAHKIDPKEETCAKTLKGLYFRLQMQDKLNQLNAEMGW